jgi:hypothetical protein
MMEEEFYSTIKLSSGEELVAKVCYLPDEDSILVENPMIVEAISQKKGKENVEGFILKEWIHATYDDSFIIRMNQVITLSELDESIKSFYLNTLERKLNNPREHKEGNIDMGSYSDTGSKQNINDLSEKGYLGSVENTKKILEELFKKS